jgi:hypothetical protein
VDAGFICGSPAGFVQEISKAYTGMKQRHRSMLNPSQQVPEPPTEDDIAKAKLGPRGIPGEKDKPDRDPDELQISPNVDTDAGHTA